MSIFRMIDAVRLFLKLRPAGTQDVKNPFARWKGPLLAAVAMLVASAISAQPVPAQLVNTIQQTPAKIVETWVEEWDPKRSCWVRLDEPLPKCSSEVSRPQPEEIVYPLPRFGPFLMLNEEVAVLDGPTSTETLGQFISMMNEFPKLRQVNLVNASGTVDDVANLKIGRMIRASKISTHVPSYGSARSGAVELFLAGEKRTMDKGARFAVHRWRDQAGRGPKDFAEHDPVNMLYLNYYMDMGMSHDKAHAFYNMTNSVPHSNALWFGPEEMRFWLEP